MSLDEACFWAALEPLASAIAAAGFAVVGPGQWHRLRPRPSSPIPDGASRGTDAASEGQAPLRVAEERLCPSPRESNNEESVEERVQLWRHPRVAHVLHGFVASSCVAAGVHLRLFDSSWRPERVFPGHIDKGWSFGDAASLRQLADELRCGIWPQALAWFDAPRDGESLLAEAGLYGASADRADRERHRRRADWLEAQGEHREAQFVRGVVAELEELASPQLPEHPLDPAEQVDYEAAILGERPSRAEASDVGEG